MLRSCTKLSMPHTFMAKASDAEGHRQHGEQRYHCAPDAHKGVAAEHIADEVD